MPKYHDDRVVKLRGLILELVPRDRLFADSLCSQFERFGDLTSKQMEWVEILTLRAENESNAGPVQSYEIIEGFPAIWTLFEAAFSKKIQWPVIRLEHCKIMGRQGVEQLRIIALPSGKYQGKLFKDGAIHVKRGKVIQPPILDELRALAASPEESLGATGRRVGACCLCGRTLTNHESIERGIGPICAETWGL